MLAIIVVNATVINNVTIIDIEYATIVNCNLYLNSSLARYRRL